MPEVAIKRIPIGARSLPVASPPDKPARVHADTCGKGERVARALHLDEIDGEAQ